MAVEKGLKSGCLFQNPFCVILFDFRFGGRFEGRLVLDPGFSCLCLWQDRAARKQGALLFRQTEQKRAMRFLVGSVSKNNPFG